MDSLEARAQHEPDADGGKPQAILFLLDPDGPDVVPSRGWRGYVVAVRPHDTPLSAAVNAMRFECGTDLELHTVVQAPEGKWIVLRSGARYRVAAR